MKPISLAALALPVVLLTGCASDVGYYNGGGYYDPGYYAYDDGYYGGSFIGVFDNDRDHSHHHHYDRGHGDHNAAFARGGSHVSHGSFAGVSRSSGHAGASHASASVSSGGGHSGGFGGGGHGGGGHR